MGFLIVHNDAFDVFGEKIAHGAFDQIRFLKHARRHRLLFDALLNRVPFLDEKREVAHKITQLLTFARRPHNDAHAVGNVQVAQNFLEAFAFLGIFNLARNARLIRVRQQHEKTSGQNQIRRDARAFGANRTFRDLHDDVRAGRIQTRNVALRNLRTVAAFRAFALDDFHAGIKLIRHDVPIMQERIFLKTDVHERGFQAVFEIADAAFEDAANEPFFGRALDVELFQLAIFSDCDTRFERLGIDDDFLVHFLFGTNQALNFFNNVLRGGGDSLDQPFRLLGNFHRREFFFHDRRNGRNFSLRFVRMFGGRGGFRFAVGRQTGGNIFGAFDFVRVTFFKQTFLSALFGDDVGARFHGVAVGFLLRGIQAAFGLEPHSATASGKVVTHNYLVSSAMDVDVLHQAHGDQRA